LPSGDCFGCSYLCS
ncbi:branched-chain amino acid transport system II carrier protein, partial [Vibrio parahaemolyticus AQ3810]